MITNFQYESSKNINSQTKSVIDGSDKNFVQHLHGRPTQFLEGWENFKIENLKIGYEYL